jgi:NAD+--dinitrogen-reductase ADP-D-ribosyltransferase
MSHKAAPYHPNIAQDGSRSASLINRCNLPPRLIGSEEFQANPVQIEIDGIQVTENWLFRRLDAIEDPEERGRVFHDYICVKFGLKEWAEYHHRADKVRAGRADGTAMDGQASPKSVYSYLHFLRLWGVDSNGHAGAVLKAWVESRFGLLATFHKGRLASDEQARAAFLEDRMRGAAKTMGVMMQLDLLYTFCQVELQRRFPSQRWTTLYRGTHDPEEYTVRSQADPSPSPSPAASASDKPVPSPPQGQVLVQFNNLSSFTSDPEVVWEFGSSAWEVKVPLPKILFFSGLLPNSILGGESEYLVLGGYYRVRPMLW